MEQLVVSTLPSWQNFYVIVGSAAGALTGLQFVVIALVAQRRIAAGTREIRAFSSPTVVHFCLALLIAAIMCAPWRVWWGISASLSAVGAFGIWSVCRAVWHARKSTVYKPDLEDWVLYSGVPLLTYIALFSAGILVQSIPGTALVTVAGVSVVLLVIGIRNAWDTVTFIAVGNNQQNSSASEGAGQINSP